jgi:hypothetical protein
VTAAQAGGHLRRLELLDEVEASGVHNVVDQPPHDGLGIGGSGVGRVLGAGSVT